MVVNKEFKAHVATFFNTHIEDNKMTFGSFEKKMKWCQDQIANKTEIGRAAVMFAMGQMKK